MTSDAYNHACERLPFRDDTIAVKLPLRQREQVLRDVRDMPESQREIEWRGIVALLKNQTEGGK